MYAEIERFRSHPGQKSPAVLAVEPLEYADEIAKLAGVRPVSKRLDIVDI